MNQQGINSISICLMRYLSPGFNTPRVKRLSVIVPSKCQITLIICKSSFQFQVVRSRNLPSVANMSPEKRTARLLVSDPIETCIPSQLALL